MARAAGILLHLTSLPGRFGIGDLGPTAHRFLGWLAHAGQAYWQILPCGPVSETGSPYGSYSAFAGNPLLISPELLVADKLLDSPAPEVTGSGRVDFTRVPAERLSLLREAWRRFREDASTDLHAPLDHFCVDPDVAYWLDDWALFAALKDRFEKAPWFEWPDPIKTRDAGALASVRDELEEELDFHRFVQFLFFNQWQRLRDQARSVGVRLFGDLAIYVAPDSVDVWAHQEMFDLAADGTPRVVAGVPPDYFSKTGQRWGNPLYRWDRLEDRGFDWWMKRLGWSLRHVDLLRLDHFRGFAGYWEVPAEESTAVNGRWRPGPGRAFFETAAATLGELPLVAEDLGVITEDVDELREAAGLPGMRVLQFAFAAPTSEHRPHCVSKNTILYTGTHDNDTARGWLERADAASRRRALDYIGGSPDEFAWGMIRAAYTSVADTVIVPIQDALELDGDARLNTPGEASGQWSWRLDQLPDEVLAERLRRLVEVSDRMTATASEASGKEGER